MATLDPRFEKLYQMALEELEGNILPFWKKHSIDEEFGGFYGECQNDGTPVPKAPKCLILNARLVWTYASAYRILGKEEYLDMAKRAYDYFCEYFLDKEHGGAYYMLNYKGEVEQDHKMVYGNAFAIYALAEYARATGDTLALDRAIEIFELLEKHAYDAPNKGYFEIYSRDWQRVNRKWHADEPEAADRPARDKSMNTHLHLIEGYTCLLRVWRNQRMEAKVMEHLEVMIDKIVNKAIGHYHMFFAPDWTPSCVDVSYGHDIEGTWLMMETCEVLGSHEAEALAKPVCLAMAKACLEESIDEFGAMWYEYQPESNKMHKERSWWVQAETCVGFLNAWEMGGGEHYLDAALKSFEFIQQYQVDHENGEWFAMLNENNQPINHKDGKISGWKAPYHNSRMCFEIIERYRKQAK